MLSGYTKYKRYITIDDLISNDRDLQNKINIDENNSFEHFSDLGFYIGIVFIFLGIFIFDDSVKIILSVVGLLTILFLSDNLRSLQSIFHKNK